MTPLPTKYLAVPQNTQITLTIHNDSTFDANNLVGTTANNLLGSSPVKNDRGMWGETFPPHPTALLA